MKRWLGLAVLVALGVGATDWARGQDLERALSVEREVQRLAGQRVLWPGFDPLAIPLAVYAGERTYLFRHPSPPEGFSPVVGARPAAFACAGRHPALTANSSTELGDVVTATLLADGAPTDQSPADLAATALHEAFHVYQRQHHPGWSGNEGTLFFYPIDEARPLGLRRLESAALRRALDAPDAAGSACWGRLALDYRGQRFAALDPAFATYERLTELNEGLAAYVQLLAAGKTTVEMPAAEFRPAEVRQRTYTTGPALAFLLDRLRPGWQAVLEADDKQSLDELLGSAIDKLAPAAGGPCAFTAEEVAGSERTAREDAAAVITAGVERRRAFDARPGWRVIVQAAEGQALAPQGFDPLNVERVAGGYLHTRFLHLGSEAGELRMLDESGADVEALTEGIGPHPLFNGIRRVTVAGLGKPEVKSAGGNVAVWGPGFSARFKNASAQVTGNEVLIQLESPR